MQSNEWNISSSEITALSNELTFRRSVFHNDRLRKVFQNWNKPEYMVLYMVRETEEKQDGNAGRIYIKELAEKMQLPVRHVSQMIGNLKDRGLLMWTHDGDGSEGTYVTITAQGKKLLTEEENRISEYYGKVITKFGSENLDLLRHLMKQLETIMHSELEILEKEEADDDING